VKNEKVKVLLVAASLVGAMLAMSVVANAQKLVRIKFARGATRANVTGTLSSYRSKRAYVVRVRAGQTLRTEQVSIGRGSHPITIYIKDPLVRSVGDSDASCNNRREITPTIAGDYRIEVVECQKADPWRGSFRFNIAVR
jgi:hypothetical protein